MIGKLCGLVVDARVATRTHDAAQLAAASQWIASNALAIRGRRLEIRGRVARPSRLTTRVAGLADLIAAIAAVPSLVDPASLPARWRIALRALGIPLLDRPVAESLAAGVSVLEASVGNECNVVVVPRDEDFLVQVDAQRLLA